MNPTSTLDWLLLHFSQFGVAGIFGAGIALLFLVIFIPSYLKEKAKNLASHEDIQILTTSVEAIKSSYTKALQRDSKIYERQLDSLSSLFLKLTFVQFDAQNCTRSLIFEGEDTDAYPAKLAASIEDAYTTMLSCQLFIDDDLIALTTDFFNKVRKAQLHYAYAKDPRMPDGQSRANDWNKAGEIAHAELPELLKQIRLKARGIIDINQPA